MLKRTGTLKRKLIKKKRKSAEESRQQTEEVLAMWKLYEEHWQITQKQWFNMGEFWPHHKCENCDVVMWGQNSSLYHHHLLEKGLDRYKHLKYEMDNLMLLCADCHTKTTNGFPGEKIKKRTEEAKVQFGIV